RCGRIAGRRPFDPRPVAHVRLWSCFSRSTYPGQPMKKILIVEDDPKIVAALEIRFQAAGYATLAAGDAASGLSKAVQQRPNLIVLDISLPAGDGLQLAKKLKSLPETRHTPFLFVTANKDPDLRA